MFGIKGFDIVIGNPPYIQIQKFPKAQKEKWVAQNFQTYAATADIYCLFYERGAQLLRDGGHLAYITSNKWMRAGYGDKLRDFLAHAVDTQTVLDFGMAQNFGAATTYTCITRFTNRPTHQNLRTCYATDDKAAMRDPSRYFEANAVVQNDLSDLPWVILPPDRHAIKKQVEAQGIPLAEWDVEINYGIKTGFNDAFYLTQDQRDAFVAQDPKCGDYLVPLLRGRYVRRYATDWDGTWMIATFPTLNLQFEKLPKPIQRHLQQYQSRLEPKPRNWKGGKWDGRKAGAYEWFETQDSIEYYREFSKPKIIYPNMTKFLPFYYDRDDGFFTNDKGFILTSNSDCLGYLTAFLNSSLFKCCFRDNFPELMGNTYEVRKIFIDILPVRQPTASEAKLFEVLVQLVQWAKKSGADIPVCDPPQKPTDKNVCATFLEDLIDACVMECYFREHMAERDLLFHDAIAPDLDKVAQTFLSADSTEKDRQECLSHLLHTHNAPTAKIRQRLDRLPTASPDWLGVILQEGKV